MSDVAGKRARARDVAEALGVSAATVSNAFNKPHQLSDRLRARILSTAEELGYAPNPAARGLRTGRSGLVGFVYPDSLSYAFADPAAVLFLRGLSEVTEGEGLGLVLLPAGARDGATLVSAPVDGFVVHSVAVDDPVIAGALKHGAPTVFVDLPSDGSFGGTAASVAVEDRAGAAAAARHLIGLGHRRLAVLAMELRREVRRGFADEARQEAATYHATRERLSGYREAVEAAGLAWSSVPVFECAANTEAQGRAALRALLSREPQPTAVLAMSDRLALAAIEEAKAKGLRVPLDLSVVGFDDVPQAAAAGLSTVRQDLVEKGRVTGRLLAGVLSGRRDDRTRGIPTELLIRASTAAPKPG